MRRKYPRVTVIVHVLVGIQALRLLIRCLREMYANRGYQPEVWLSQVRIKYPHVTGSSPGTRWYSSTEVAHQVLAGDVCESWELAGGVSIH